MNYINQREYPHIPYPTGLDLPDHPAQKGSIKEAGCGLCTLSMVVDQLTTQELTLEEGIALSRQYNADRNLGTCMHILAPHVAERFNLSYSETDSIQEAIEALQKGGRVICNVGGDRDDGAYVGLFSHGGHYILLLSADRDELCILDPSWTTEKFKESGREGKVREEGIFLYCHRDLLARDADNRSPAFYLFARK